MKCLLRKPHLNDLRVMASLTLSLIGEITFYDSLLKILYLYNIRTIFFHCKRFEYCATSTAAIIID